VELRGYNSNAVPQRFLLHNHDDIYLLSRKRRLNLTLIIMVSIMAATGAVTAVSGQLTSASSPSWVNLLVQLRSNDSEVRPFLFASTNLRLERSCIQPVLRLRSLSPPCNFSSTIRTLRAIRTLTGAVI